MNGQMRILIAAVVAATLTCCVLVFCFVAALATAFLGGYITWVPQDNPPVEVTTVPTLEPGPGRPAPTPTPEARRFPTPSPAETESWPSVDTLDQTVVPERDMFDLTRRLRHIPDPILRVVPGPAGGYRLGDRELFWIADSDAKTYFTATATLRAETPHAYFWVDEAYNVDGAALQSSADRFENAVYPTNHRVFGSEWVPGVDDDAHLHIFNGRVPGVGGYFSSADEYPLDINPFSNQREMFYINLDNAQPGTDYYDGILAHEFQHMIHWNVDRNEDTWVNEGLSELAAQINELDTGNSAQAFRNSPDTQLNAWADDPSQAAPHYGASHLIFAYLLGRWNEALVQQIAAQQENGIAGIQKGLDLQGVSFEQAFADWTIANALDRDRPGAGRYNYPLLDVPSVRTDVGHRRYPVLRSSTVHQFAADYVEFMPDETGTLHLTFRGAREVKLIPNQAHSGRFQWWSNRGDQADMTLTRAFDLRGLHTATLDAWLWYDIEEDYDYAYIEVSTDHGGTWDILRGPRTTDRNPNANSFGWAYTGISSESSAPSGGQADAPAAPTWVHEIVDLSDYAGREILLRFEYITDDAVNRPGFAVDDVSIPEMGYFDGFEQDDGSWIAAGFARIDNRLPQRFVVQAVIETANPNDWRTKQMVMSADQAGELTVPDFGDGVKRVLLVIAGLTEQTTELAEYQYEATINP